MAITDWPEDERPREKLLAHGAEHLSDAELLALFLRVGVKGKSAVDLARDLLLYFGSLEQLFQAPHNALCQVHGMGSAKYCQLQAVLEMSKRALQEELRKADAFTSPASVKAFLKLRLRGLDHEEFHALFLNTAHQLISAETLFKGSLSETRIYPREVARRALALNAAAVIVAHNHPSGSPQPSDADIHITRQLRNTLEIIDVSLLDHCIIAAHQVISMAELGLV
ncbi:RadC family protein [Iodobacter fluviatilis]|uniref:DNA repair protein RadC n=1 Tax=Iodobacter fluviatilis TaxID=537 RepID=A0A377QAE8_9NEIS|nr:DNA repair protein RadC [Iodobacter fluviatilis]TCU81277.1 DNA replication and repair protein RadC [Iodobacter fluviatilis]STQ91685.1 DNA repair protein RadC [Iodobacter fluviatilis]